ncbi:CPBP family intramembrane glutamic endopeptidase [Neobacillus ginsengisoli]|uniref:Membrane protease YdiL (CAAX protease family) n=1 Tax=Neobacillus ginsengisoli TaxID=904295 RepID=A0ABT9XS54_9BACI|nr:type II CAAX endopeptidase family protein [Neobacillus ginsengisoli]MDQ0198393.1 membrane protease YdiL (CAAX protease family) [Neobacillus ginsengisoli]
MKKRPIDFRLLFGLVIAHFLLFFSFQDKTIFWYIFSASLLLLITYAMFQEEVDDEASFFTYLSFGAMSGLFLYIILWLGYHAIGILHLPFINSISRLYRWFAPSVFWQYLALVLVAAPGEELFWRGFIQKRLLTYYGPLKSILIASVLYASVYIYSGSFIFVLASFISGIIWGCIYFWKKSMPMVIVSHLVFDIMIFIILPLK